MVKKINLSVLLVAFLFTLSLASSLLVSPYARATSAYDDNFVTTSTVTVDATIAGSTCNPTDLTTNWKSYILDSSKWRSGDDWSAARSSLLAAFANGTDGQWGVSESEVVGNSAGGNGYNKMVTISWSEDSTAHFDWVNYTSNGEVAYVGTQNIALIACSDSYWGDNNPDPVVVDTVLNTTLSWVSQKASSPCGYLSGQPVQWCTRSNLFSYSMDPNYPTGYDGATVQAGSAVTPITGNVQCANTNNVISVVGVNAQSGADGDATITDDGAGGKNYSYYLSEESPYSLIVICDSEPFYGPTVEADLYRSYDWACTTMDVLNICAAS